MKKNKRFLKRLIEVSASLMLATGVGAVLSSQNTASVQAVTVTATKSKLLQGHHILDDDGEEMMPIDEYLTKTAAWNTTPNPYKLNGKNNIKFKWYKKVKIRNAWDNTDMHGSLAINAITDDHGASPTGGKVDVMGEATVNGIHYYITGDPDEQQMAYYGSRSLEPKEYFEPTKLGYLTKNISSWFALRRNSKMDATGYDGIVLKDGNTLPKHTTIMIPSHHDPVELFGTKYVPVLSTSEFGVTGGSLIKYSDFQNYVKSGEGHKFMYSGDENYQKNGKVYSKETDVYKAAKIENRKLKSAKRRKAYEKGLINDLKRNAQAQRKYGLAD